MPLHAASANGHLGESCSDYFVSSYTPTLAAVINARRGLQPVSMAQRSALLIAESDSPGLSRLEKADEEVATIGSILSPMATTLLVGDTTSKRNGATVNTVLENLPSATILHLACHGEQDPTNPLLSGFCLRDGRLTVAQLMRLNLQNALFAFLSACETAKGDSKQPDQAVHLAAAILFVGFRSVIATMWYVLRHKRIMKGYANFSPSSSRSMNDEDGPIVAKTLYSELMKNDMWDPDAIPFALDLAVRKLRKSGVPPYRWAPYIHMGA